MIEDNVGVKIPRNRIGWFRQVSKKVIEQVNT